jgi:UDP-glucuronate 4-epimerase
MNNLKTLFEGYPVKAVVNLAAQAGVRYSIQNPLAYIQSNIVGFSNLIELAKVYEIDHFIYASSSSVYGTNEKMPFSVDDSVDRPASLYAATKKSNELIAHTYSHLFGLRTTGLRFFTVYGPWGRPDMALFLFTSAIISGNPLDVYNNGNMSRDFTYVDDIVTGLINIILDRVTQEYTPSDPPYKLYNIGNGAPVKLLDFIETIENKLCWSTGHNYLPLQPGDVVSTWADTEALFRDYGFRPSTPIETGVSRFLTWYRTYYNV